MRCGCGLLGVEGGFCLSGMGRWCPGRTTFMIREYIMEQCPICAEQSHHSQLGSRDAYAVNCPRCGLYNLTRTASVNLKNSHFSDREIANISGWLHENSIFEITSYNIDNLKQLKTPSFHERADKLLEYIEKKTEFAGNFLMQDKSWLGAGWCVNWAELREVVLFLQETRRVEASSNLTEKQIKICPAGWAHLETLKKINSDKEQCFVAMWFSEDLLKIYDNIISKAIVAAGYSPHLVNQREHNDKIDDEIISQIRRSRFVLADFTGHRGGVYFEAGFAKGLGLEVFWSCRDDDIDNLHFDIRQYNCITWRQDNLEEFKLKITYRIESVLGRGPYQEK